jgi:hypothetical protein
MRATVERPIAFHTVADHLAAAVSALRRQRMNGTLKTIENMGTSLQCDFKRLVILVSTSFTSGHGISPFQISDFIQSSRS